MARVPTTLTGTKKFVHHDYPVLFNEAEQASARGQRGYVQSVRLELVLALLAAMCGISLVSFGFMIDNNLQKTISIAAVIFFVITIGIQFLRQNAQFADRWVDGRTVAESIKTLTWKYSMGGDPFPITADSTQEEHLRQQFIAELARIPDGATSLHLQGSTLTDHAHFFTPKMRELRSQPIEVRRDYYYEGRVLDQLQWYRRKSRLNRKAANNWNRALFLLKVGGIALAALKIFDLIQIDLLGTLGILTTGIAAIVSWLELKQNQKLARSYGQTAHDLEAVEAGLKRQQAIHATDERSWAHFVDQAEDAISRENKDWSASHHHKFDR